MPDKAIDLIDEAASHLKIEIESQPTELDQVERKILQLNIEKVSLSKESDKASKERLAKIVDELANLSAKRDAMKLKWQNEKTKIEESRKLKEELEQLHNDEIRFTREGNLAKAAEIKYGRIPEIEKRLSEIEAEEDKTASEEENLSAEKTSLLRQEVSEEDIAKIVSAWTGIPVTKC